MKCFFYSSGFGADLRCEATAGRKISRGCFCDGQGLKELLGLVSIHREGFRNPRVIIGSRPFRNRKGSQMSLSPLKMIPSPEMRIFHSSCWLNRVIGEKMSDEIHLNDREVLYETFFSSKLKEIAN
jgi:hypothetical protein